MLTCTRKHHYTHTYTVTHTHSHTVTHSDSNTHTAIIIMRRNKWGRKKCIFKERHTEKAMATMLIAL